MGRYSYFVRAIFATTFMGIAPTLSTLRNCRCFEPAGILMRFISDFLGEPKQKHTLCGLLLKLDAPFSNGCIK